jgi:hypothetical protein
LNPEAGDKSSENLPVQFVHLFDDTGNGSSAQACRSYAYQLADTLDGLPIFQRGVVNVQEIFQDSSGVHQVLRMIALNTGHVLRQKGVSFLEDFRRSLAMEQFSSLDQVEED